MANPLINIQDYTYFFLVWLISTIVVRFLVKTLFGPRTRTRLLPSPPALPIIGHLHLMDPPLQKSLQTLATKYGPIMQICMGSTQYVVVSNATIAEEILKTNDVVFASKFEPGPAQYNIYPNSSFLNSPYGVYWRFMKRLCLTKLFAGPQLDSFGHIREEEIIKLLRSLIARSREGKPCDLSIDLNVLTNNIICKMAMGRECKDDLRRAVEIRRFIREIMGYAAKFRFNEIFGPLRYFDLFGNGKKLTKLLWGYDELLEQIMKDYEEDDRTVGRDEEKDVMDILLETYRDTNADLKLTRDQIKYFFMEIFMAGVDTTSAALYQTMAELINHPEIFNKLQHEIDSVLGPTRLICESDVPNLPYLRAVIMETLRLHPPGPLLRRQCTVDTQINGYDVKAGTRIFINGYAIMRDPQVYSDVERFMPERFMVDDGAEGFSRHLMAIKGHDFNFLPFGSGRRRCAGTVHAFVVMNITIGVLVQCFHWRVKDGVSVDVKSGNGYSGATAQPLVCFPIVRFDPFD